jgi:hypothetical protein
MGNDVRERISNKLACLIQNESLIFAGIDDETLAFLHDFVANREIITKSITAVLKVIGEEIDKFDYKTFDSEAMKSEHFCVVCHSWYKNQITKLLTDLRARLEGR